MVTDKKKISVPYIDQTVAFWEKLAQNFGSNIKEVYFPIEKKGIGTGRPFQPDNYLTDFLESRILPVSTLVNPVVLPNQYQELRDVILNEIEKYILKYSIKGVTVANLDLAKDIKENFPELELTASTLMEISSIQQLTMLGDVFDILVPSSKVIRDINNLKLIKTTFSGKIKILVNESCLPSCVYRTQHFFEMSTPSISYPCSLCNRLLEEKPWLRLTGSWILPQHLHMIEDFYDEIKLAGRVSLSNPDVYTNVLSAYLNHSHLLPNTIGGGPASVYLPIKISSKFYKATLYCDKNCANCLICKNYWDKNVKSYE